ncbi:hypothetical protein [Mesorhizobium sp.]|uniref:hypothetical protein n=1 Tax=Mesorhizobium sp. TaxID=1871066 RepID=UPI000FE83712|nr:hypothetical protein [Mesorhizobium sp.]RWP62574.1 MAG: hypothetical protein EOR07_19895 [Mesorhizobium sp.]
MPARGPLCGRGRGVAILDETTLDEVDDIPGEIEPDEDSPAEKGPRDRAFNPWRYAASATAKAIIAEAVHMVEGYEDHRAPRTRKRKADDQRTFEATIAAVLCDLINHELVGFPKGIHITRSKQVLSVGNRHKAPALNSKLPDLLDKLATPELDYIRLTSGHRATFGVAKRTTMKPGPRLLDRISQSAIKPADFGQYLHNDVIFLREPKTDPMVKPKLVTYVDTPQTDLFRTQMRTINSWLMEAETGFEPGLLTGKPIAVDTRQRMLRRIFSRGKFTSGGRLWGGFWMQLTKRQREEALFIDQDEIVELDYGQMAPRLFYAIKGLQPPDKDLYAIPGYEQHREGIKKVMNSMFFAVKPITKMPRGVRKKFAEQHRITDVVAAITDYHPDIADLFHRGLGHEAQFTESQIMIDILLTLKDMDIVALPIHDAILVAASNEDEAQDVMLNVFKARTGMDGSVD